jgi:hypothetical protein
MTGVYQADGRDETPGVIDKMPQAAIAHMHPLPLLNTA